MASGSKVKKGSNVRQLRSNRTAARTRAPQRSVQSTIDRANAGFRSAGLLRQQRRTRG